MNPVAGTPRYTGWYYGWNIVAVCIVAQAAGNALPINAFSLFLKSWSDELHTPISTLQLGLAGCGIGCALISPIVGALTDKYPARLLFGIGLSGVALFLFGISYVTATWQFIALYAVLAPIAIVLSTSIPANAVVSRWFVKKIGLALGLTAFGLAVAGVMMPPIVAAVMPEIGWRAMWRIAGALTALVILPLTVFVLKDRPTEKHGRAYIGDEVTTSAGHHGAVADGGIRWVEILSRKNFWLLVIVYLPMLGVYGGAGQNLAPIALSRGLTAQAAGVMLSIFSLAQLVATLAGGVLSDRFGNRVPLAGLAFCAALAGVALAFGNSFVVIAVGAALAGAAGGFWPVLAAAIAREFGTAGFGRAFGTATFFLPFAVLAPFAVAKGQESTGSYVPTLLVIAAVALIGGLACLLLKERPRAGLETELAVGLAA